MLFILYALLGYLVVGLIVHHVVFPEKTPYLATYFKPGVSFNSKLEGLSQKVIRTENGNVAVELTLTPNSPGPVTHVHEGFDETFSVVSGTLSLEVAGEVRRLNAGETLVVPKNTPHRPFNETGSPVVATTAMPLEFGFCLSQIYPFWDENEANSKPPKILFQLAAFGGRFDSYPTVDAPPKPLLKTLKFLLGPTARLAGYRLYQEKYQPK